MKLLKSQLYIKDLKKALCNINLEQLQNKTIAVTGGLGLIGSPVVDLLFEYGKLKKIYVLGRDPKKFEERYSETSNIEFVKYDALKDINFEFVPDYIIHSAGLANPALYINQPVETILSNFVGVYSLLEFAKRTNVKRLLYISSSEVYGTKNTNEAFKEGIYGTINIDNIRSSYPVAKRSAEMLCNAYNTEYNLRTLIVRPGHIYGPSASKKDMRISSEFAFLSAEGKHLELKSSGLQKRSYCYSIDCAAQILTVLLKGEPGEAYNIGHDEITSIREMASFYAKAGNVKLIMQQPTSQELAAFNPMNNATLDNTKIKSLGYKNLFSVEEGCIHTVKILKEFS